MKTIYEVGDKNEIAIFEMLKNNPNIISISARRIQRGTSKGDIKLQIVYKEKPNEKADGEEK
jgi:hypothetical protein